MRDIDLIVKRLFDIGASILALILMTFIPVLIIIPIITRITSRGRAVFIQERIGKNGKPFKIFKYRTMRIPKDSFDKEGKPLENNARITPFGGFLRKTSLDEILQLFNVLNGTMSLVGPRPTLKYQVEKYNKLQRKRLEMRPGLTGLAQINGRNDLTWVEKILYDIEYVEKFNIWLDVKILRKTVLVIFRKKGIEFNKSDAISKE